MTQEPNMTLDSFYTKLKHQAVNCKFADVDAELKSHIIQRTSDSDLCTEAVGHPEYELADILRIGRTHELSRMQSK